MNISLLNTELFYITHLNAKDRDTLKDFVVDKIEGKNLERYITGGLALFEETQNVTRTYLIRDIITREIVAYFSLRTGLITKQDGLFSFHTLTGIELANFAVNDAYRNGRDVSYRLGEYVFTAFIMPIVKAINELLGAKYLYIFALPEKRLLAHYEKMGFQRLELKVEAFIHRHVRPRYDKGCIFMLTQINE